MKHRIVGKLKEKRIEPKSFSIMAGLWAFTVTLLVIGVFLVRPVLSIDNHVIVVDDGVALAALVVGTAFWGIVEALTPPGIRLRHLFLRVSAAFLAGLFVGGFAALVFNFGQYLVMPAYYGNTWADFEAFTIGIFTIVTAWHAAWLHTRSYKYGMKKLRGSAKRNGGPAKKIAPGLLMVPMAGTFDPSSIISQIWNLIWGFIQIIMNAIGRAFGSTIGQIADSFNGILASWANSVAGYGIWSFVMAAVSLGVTFVVAYFMMIVVDAARDITGVESAL